MRKKFDKITVITAITTVGITTIAISGTARSMIEAFAMNSQKGKTMIQIDIDMPKSCLECICAQPYADSPFWDVWCRPLGRYIDERQTGIRQLDCPLKEVKSDD